jgi:sugar/nucleoside kinase (ribokinase family)
LRAKFIHVPAYCPVLVVDTLAAGDTFIAACLHFLNEGNDLLYVLQKATKLAGLKVGQKSVLDLDLDALNSD